MTTLLVTGGAGFIGSNFVRRVLLGPSSSPGSSPSSDTASTEGLGADDLRVVVVDALTYAGNLDNLSAVADDPRFAFEKLDIADRSAVQEALARHRPAAIVNFAAESHVDRSIDDASAFIQTNIVGTFELLQAARQYLDNNPKSRDAFRFVHVSTDEVYGSLGATGAFTETTAYAPNSPYAASKASADLLVRSYFKTYGLPTLVSNCSNNYGPFQFPEKLIPLMILNALEGKDLPIYGDGSNVRDWIYVEDHCEGVLASLLRGVPGEKYNFGGSAERSNVEVVDAICDALEELRPGAENPALAARSFSSYRQLKTFVTDRPGHDWRYAIDDAKARQDLQWKPRRQFTQGLLETVRWYLDNPQWTQRIQDGTYQRERLGLVQGPEALR